MKVTGHIQRLRTKEDLIEVMPLAQAPAAYERMMSGQARFRVVLDTTA
ncbi:hypothetical protein AB0N06_37930 [Streptomyces sp. NPDC051020]